MERNKVILALAAAAAVSGLAASNSSASVLLLNFGASMVSASSVTVSPAYASGAWTSQATTTWNSVGTADIASGIKYYDGSSAAGVAINLAGANGTSSVPPSTLTFGGSAEPSNAKSISNGAGVFSLGDPANGATFQSASGGTGQYTATGANISGLAAGTYAVYVVSINYFNYNSQTVPENVWINATTVATDPTSTAYTIPSASNALLAANTAGSQNAWTMGTNFVETTVTLSGSTPNLTVVTEGDSGLEERGILNSIEIVPVATPEPASIGLFVAAAGLLLRRRRVS